VGGDFASHRGKKNDEVLTRPDDRLGRGTNKVEPSALQMFWTCLREEGTERGRKENEDRRRPAAP